MYASSRNSLAQLTSELESRRSSVGFELVADELYLACDLLGREKSLRQALSDSGRSAQNRGEIVQTIFGSKLSAPTVEILDSVARSRWSSTDDLVQAVRTLANQTAFMVAANNGTLGTTEDEIFRIGRAISGSADLQSALTNPAISGNTKAGIVADLLAGKSTATTQTVVGFTLSHLDGRRIDQAIDELVALAAAQASRVVASVRVARPLDEQLTDRMVRALNDLTGQQVQLNVVVDPSVLGGALVTINGEVIDGTIASRLAEARRTVVGKV